MSIADFAFPAPVQKILRAVYSQPDHAFMLSDLIARAGVGRGNGQRYVERLLNSGVLKEEPRRGHQRAIRANKDFPLYPELQGICRKSFGLVEPIKDALKPFESQITEAFLFGSVAKGNDTHRSDIDLMIIGAAPMMSVMEALMKAEDLVGRPIHLTLYTDEEWADLKTNDSVLARISDGTIQRIFPNVDAS